MKKTGKLLTALGCAGLLLGLNFTSALAQVQPDTEQNFQKTISRLSAQVNQLKKEIEMLKKEKEGFTSSGTYHTEKSKVKFYGYIKIDTIYEDATCVGSNYILWVLPKSLSENDSKFDITYRHSRFGFDIIKPYKTWKLKGKFEMDFYTFSKDVSNKPWNPQHAPLRARRVFLLVEKGTWKILAGNEWMTIAQLYPHLSNFPAGSFMGNLGYRTPQIRLTKKFPFTKKDALTMQFAITRPFAFPNMNGVVIWDNDPNVDAGIPGFQGRIAFDMGKTFHIALFGHYSKDEYFKDYKTYSGKIRVDSFSSGLELKIGLPDNKFKPYIAGELWYGQNLDGYYTGGVNQGVKFRLDNGTYVTDFKTVDLTQRKIDSAKPIHAVGGWVEFGFNPTLNTVVHLGWGIDNPNDDELKGVRGARLSQQMYYGNIMYKFTKEFGVGLEYLRAVTRYRDGDAPVNRGMLSFYYFF
jgi:hypothetical protein